MGGTWPNRVEEDVASVEFELRREDCCEDEEKWALDCDGGIGPPVLAVVGLLKTPRRRAREECVWWMCGADRKSVV